MKNDAATLKINRQDDASDKKPTEQIPIAIDLSKFKAALQSVRDNAQAWNDAKVDLWATRNSDAVKLDTALAAAKKVQNGYAELKKYAAQIDLQLAGQGLAENHPERIRNAERAAAYDKEISDFNEQIAKIETVKLRVGVNEALKPNSWEGVRDGLLGNKKPDFFPTLQDAANKGEGKTVAELKLSPTESAPLTEEDYAAELQKTEASIAESDDYFKPFIDQKLIKRDEKTGKLKIGFWNKLFQGGLAKQVAEYNALVDKQIDYTDKVVVKKRDGDNRLQTLARRGRGLNIDARIGSKPAKSEEQGAEFKLTGSENPTKLDSEWTEMVAQAEKGENLGEKVPEAHPFDPNADYLGAIERMTAARRAAKAAEKPMAEQPAAKTEIVTTQKEDEVPEGHVHPELFRAIQEAGKQKRTAETTAATAAVEQQNFDLGVTFQNIATEISNGAINNRETLAAALRRDGLMNARGEIKNAGESDTMDFEEMFALISKKRFLGLGERKFNKANALQFFDSLAARYLDQKMNTPTLTRAQKFHGMNRPPSQPLPGGLWRG